MNKRIYAVLLCCSNGDAVTIYESANESDARARYNEEVTKQGTPVNVTDWTDSNQAWRRACVLELVGIERDDDGDISDIDTLEVSDYYWRN